MADEIPSIQILDKKNYFQQALVPLPNALPYPPLAPSSLRLRTVVLSITVNNFTYATLGTLLNWWDVHPLPASTPAPYNDASTYGRISAWGYAEVLESTVPSIAKGTYVWGYVPLGTLAQDLEVKLHSSPAIKDQFFVTSAYRAHVMPIYNRYFISSVGADEIAQKTPEVARDAVLRVMHSTAFLMERFAFSADAARVVAPGMGADEGWSAEDASLDDATVVIFAPGSKAAVTFTTLLQKRVAGAPRRIIGASSASSKAFVQGTGVYDSVVTTSADPITTVGADIGKRLVIFDFGGRAGIASQWATTLAARHASFLFVIVGSGVIDPATAHLVFAAMAKRPPYNAAQVNADDMRRRAMQRVGEETYWSEEAESWEGFRKDGIKGLNATWGEGMEDVIKGWDRLAHGDALPSEGLVFKI
ncbi:hypothetical protein GGR51DRAFT_543259 [Nemania sp. FL0031]|nr:hypothetical protein GGR51DRAFT_543259 [Nemania sp. FL0031]